MVLIYFLVACLEFSMYRIMSSADRDGFRFSFPTYMPFIFLSYLLALDRTSLNCWIAVVKAGFLAFLVP